MNKEKKTRAFKCKTCKDWDAENKQCKLGILIENSSVKDTYGNPICKQHKNKQNGNLTGGYREEKERTKVWFISDLHFFHKSILFFHPKRREHFGITLEELQNDTVSAVNKMNEILMKEWNDTIKRGDTVYILGDFSLGTKEETEKILNKLHGKKFLITGNHDKSLKGLERYFEDVAQIKEAKFTNNQFSFIDPEETFSVEMCHYPLLTWNRRQNGSCMIHGHCHDSVTSVNDNMMELRVDVGYDCSKWNYHFVELEELYNYFVGIRNKLGCKTFKEYTNKLIDERKGVKG